jgi:hypothetical protein
VILAAFIVLEKRTHWTPTIERTVDIFSIVSSFSYIGKKTAAMAATCEARMGDRIAMPTRLAHCHAQCRRLP